MKAGQGNVARRGESSSFYLLKFMALNYLHALLEHSYKLRAKKKREIFRHFKILRVLSSFFSRESRNEFSGTFPLVSSAALSPHSGKNVATSISDLEIYFNGKITEIYHRGV